MDLPIDRIHSTFLSKSGSGVSQSSSEDGHSVVHTARISVQDFLGNKSPIIHFIRNVWGNSFPSLMRDMDVPRIPIHGGKPRRFGHGRNGNSFGCKKDGSSDACRIGC